VPNGRAGGERSCDTDLVERHPGDRDRTIGDNGLAQERRDDLEADGQWAEVAVVLRVEEQEPHETRDPHQGDGVRAGERRAAEESQVDQWLGTPGPDDEQPDEDQDPDWEQADDRQAGPAATWPSIAAAVIDANRKMIST
jgi:hypothetical protein